MTAAVALGWLALGACGLAGILALVADMIAGERASVAPSALLLAVASLASGAAAFAPSAGAPDSVPLVVGGVGSIVFALGASAVVVAGQARGPAPAQAAALIALCAGGCVVLAGARDVVVFLVAAEAVALSSYAMVAHSADDRSDEAALKYFVQGSVAAGALVLAVAVLVGASGGFTSYADLAQLTSGAWSGAASLAMMLMVGVSAFKLGAVPFHSWAPDAYETAPPAASSFIATAPKLAMAVAAVQLVREGPFASGFGTAGFAMASMAVASIAVGNLAGLRQRSYTRMLGYSGVAHAGYLLVAAAVPLGGIVPVALLGVSYAVASAGAFATAAAVRGCRPGWDGSIEGLTGLGREKPLLSVSIAIFMFSLTGIPLTVGFWGKLIPLLNAFRADAGWLALIALAGSVVSFGYYGRVIRAVFLDPADGARTPSRDDGPHAPDAPASMLAVVSVLAVLVVVLGTLPLFVGVGPLASLLAGF